MLGTLLIGAALAILPTPIGKTMDVDLSLHPALAASTKGAWTRVDLSVDAAGQPMRCDIAVSDGVRRLDAAACSVLMNSARFVPGRDPEGRAIAALVRHDFAINGAVAPNRNADFAIPVDRLPGAGAPLFVDVALVTDAAGHASACEIVRSSNQAQFDRLACRETLKAAYEPVRDRAGQPVRALREASVAFIAASGTAAN